jgi:excisionase family DNA binding protein
MGQLVSVKQAAAMLSVSQPAIRKWIRQGKLRAVRVASLLRIRVADLEEFLQQRS